MAALALEFAILTAARTGEVLGARWEEVDLEKAIWTVPAERMKAHREHRVPLSARVVAILQSLSPKGSGIIFAGSKTDAPLSNMALLMLLRRMERGNLTAHGFRSIFRDWASEATHFPSELSEMALAHVIPNKVEAAYRRGDLLDKRRQMMEAWSAHCEQRSGTVLVFKLNGAPEAGEG